MRLSRIDIAHASSSSSYSCSILPIRLQPRSRLSSTIIPPTLRRKPKPGSLPNPRAASNLLSPPSMVPGSISSRAFSKLARSVLRHIRVASKQELVERVLAAIEDTTAPDLPPKPGVHAAFARDHEYKRHGTLSLLAGIDLVTGKVHALVKDRPRSCEFIEFLQLLDSAYPASTAIKIVLDNHSAHTSKETKAWLATQPEGRFEFTFTPKHGSWLNLVEGFFSKLAPSVLRHIRVASKQELVERVLAAIEDVNQQPVVHTWSYKLESAT